MSNPIIDAPDELTIPVAIGGVSQETWDSLAFWNTRGVLAIDEPGGRATIEIPRYLLPLDGVDRWTSLGSIVTQYDVWHEINDVTKLCPYSVDTGEPGWQQETWETWGVGQGGSFAPVQIGQYWYRSNQYAPAGERLASTAWYLFIDAPDTLNTGIVRLLTVEEFQAIQQSANPTPGP